MKVERLTIPAMAVVAMVLFGAVAAGLVSAQDATTPEPPTTSDCASGSAVPDAADNPGLVSDCEALLSARDTLAGTATLNWSANTRITAWNGVEFTLTSEGALRVVALIMGHTQLTGEIPSELGNLTDLKWIELHDNQLTGEIPSELGSLSNLQELYLGLNQLSGEVPPELGNLSNLAVLSLLNNQLTGEIPPELGNLSNLAVLRLDQTQLTGKIPPELGNLSNLVRLRLSRNYVWCVPEVVLQLLPNLISTDIHLLPVCTEEDPVLTVDGDPQIYNDNVFVLPVAENLATADHLPMWEYAARFFEYFDDEFDFLIFYSNLDKGRILHPVGLGYLGRYSPVMNDVEGIGLSIFSGNRNYGGSGGALQGVIHFSTHRSPLRHELMHRWANFIVPTGYGPHWGFSSADGQLGGFDIDELVDHGGGRYSAGSFGVNGIPGAYYSAIELYLAGFIPPEEVPDLLVAEDGKWLRTEDGDRDQADDGDYIFTASQFRTYTIEDIISQYGRRIPDASQAQRDFRAAAILLIDEYHPAINFYLDQMSGYLTSFSRTDTDEDWTFFGATGGRGTIAMDGLSQFLKDAHQAPSPGAPTGLTATGNSQAQIDLSWSAPLNDGGSAITAYDLRYIETSADETMDSNWTVVQDVWTTGSGGLQYTVTGLTGGTQYDVQVRAVNAAGDGPWSATATGTPAMPSVCVTGGAVADAANTGLAADCEALLSARDTLAGTGSLNWSADIPITAWDGVTVEGTLERVTELSLASQGLTGTIPPELGSLANLELLNLSENQLTGTIPPELGSLANLGSLWLNDNELTGCIPAGLGDVEVNDFDDLGLQFCMLTEEELLDRYDANDNGIIDRDEAVVAVADYFAGVISRDEVIALIALYFASSG